MTFGEKIDCKIPSILLMLQTAIPTGLTEIVAETPELSGLVYLATIQIGAPADHSVNEQ